MSRSQDILDVLNENKETINEKIRHSFFSMSFISSKVISLTFSCEFQKFSIDVTTADVSEAVPYIKFKSDSLKNPAEKGILYSSDIGSVMKDLTEATGVMKNLELVIKFARSLKLKDVDSDKQALEDYANKFLGKYNFSTLDVKIYN